ncbi:hypothetical protein CC99x_002010 [Candidatus Berkiella cookevillensis]|uniref:Uncharacterized protein n=1 Tax=Candidatus Berkiella cookevillensis TaxID=437022 RepID=A0A0Q9YGJ8_9GAMM|nr:hypothetical protein [Candidatus Berkiella cookevillensis]MCS5707673.1 hypothetical protein [Candidatus Berkiella cookevillensis]
MNIVDALLKYVGLRSGEQSKDIFYQRFLNSEYSWQLRKPLLVNSPSTVNEIDSLQRIPFERLSFLELENPSNQVVKIRLQENVIHKLKNFEKAFNIFVDFTSHSNPLGDFRKFSSFYHPLYCTSRYLFFHGDGNCVTLGVLLYSFLTHYFEKDSIKLKYSCALKREFMHVYALRERKNHKILYVDPDQKIFCGYDELDQIYSHGLIFQLLSGAGYYVFDQIPIIKRKHFFLKMTEDLMDNYRITPTQLIYQKEPEKNDFSRIFLKARIESSQDLELFAEDYEWKKSYREIGKKIYQQPLPFLSQLKNIITVIIPPQGQLTLGWHNSFPQEVLDFCLIFFGRVPLSIDWEAKSAIVQEVVLPEIPWIILFGAHVNFCILNQKRFDLHRTQCGNFAYLGMGDLEAQFDGITKDIKMTIQVLQDTFIKIVLPFNALAVNANLISLTSEHEDLLNIKYQAA